MREEIPPQTTYTFPRPEDDHAEQPYLLGFLRKEITYARLAGALVALVAVGLAAGAGAALWLLLLLPAAVLGLVVPLIFRNPRRAIPADLGALIAPSDGRVVQITRTHESEFLGTEALRISIMPSPFDAHVNRFPCTGQVCAVERIPGSLRGSLGDAPLEAIVIGLRCDGEGSPPGARILLRQIGGSIGHRIVCRARAGDFVWRGGLLGVNTIGSRTELLVPVPGDRPFELCVEEGDRVRAGASILGAWKEPHGCQPSHDG
jgi:phosphatidylserine decarboxylase